MNTAVIGLGTNLGDRMENLRSAVKALSELVHTKVTEISHIYETEPVGFTDQPNFLNAVLKLDTDLSPLTVLGACLGIEASLGRVRDPSLPKGPRSIDLDLLLYEHVKCESFELMLPHPRILERAFVMVPLADLYPSGRAPGLYFDSYLKEIDTSGVRRWNEEL